MTKKESESWEQKQYREMINDLKNIETIYVAGSRKSNNPNWDKGIWRHFNVYYIKDNKLERVWFYPSLKKSQIPSSWDQDTHSFTDVVLGSNRFHEIVYSIYGKVYPNSNDSLYKMPRIDFLSSFDGNCDDRDEYEAEEEMIE